MEKRSNTFMQALKLWFIWAMVANTSLRFVQSVAESRKTA